jgi:hypothetical protein
MPEERLGPLLRTKRERENYMHKERQKFGTAGVIEMATNFHMVMNTALLQHSPQSAGVPTSLHTTANRMLRGSTAVKHRKI